MTSTTTSPRSYKIISSSPTASQPLIPPLPPLPPTDDMDEMKELSQMVLASTAENETRESKSDGESSIILNQEDEVRLNANDMKNVVSSSNSAITAEKHKRQDPYFPYIGIKKSHVFVDEMEMHPELSVEGVDNTMEDTNLHLDRMRVKEDDRNLFRQSHAPSHGFTQPGRTIWSITPEELSELAKGITEMKKEIVEPIKKVSYSEPRKCSVIQSALNRVTHRKAMAPEPAVRTFKKYYGLPNIQSFEPLHSGDTEVLEAKAAISCDSLTGTGVDSRPQNRQDYSQVFGLSPMTPTFYPRQSTETNELIQMLKSSLTSKKVAPHMDWWPGDWKCTNCGNHNFSYRDTCKRCRVGRLKDAGFVFPTSSVDSSA